MLSPQAEKIIENYFNLPYKDIGGVRCPYFNNTRRAARGQLRVLVGKGSPEEIVEESKIISIQYKLGLFDKNGTLAWPSPELIRKFLIEQNLGIECSGFVSHVLRAHYLETKKIDITKKIRMCAPNKFIRNLITKLRPIENMDVKVFACDYNSEIINYEKNGFETVQPGDYIIMLETGPLQKRNHIVLITANDGRVLDYVHARSWSSEGKYGHGVSRGKIIINPNSRNLINQEWVENNLSGEKNETWLEAKQAKILEIRRLHI
jgi:hypothetical protein